MLPITLSYCMREGRFSLCAYSRLTEGKKRNYRTVTGLINPDFSLWDRKKQMFVGTSKEVKQNNQYLQDLKKRYEDLVEMFWFTDGTELFKTGQTTLDHALEKKKRKPKPAKKTDEQTLGEFIEKHIDNLKRSVNRNPSRNYQLYIALLSRLGMEGTILNKPLSKICNKDFIDFGDFLLNKMHSKNKGNNYVRMMGRFKTVHKMAFDQELNNNMLRYPYKKYAPIINTTERLSLDEKQYKAFLEYDLNKITCKKSQLTLEEKEMFRDFCIFLYETKMRPVDVVKLQRKQISNGKIVYIPEKKKNYQDPRKRNAVTPLTETAADIVKKYQKKSVNGYVFPLEVNKYEWDYTDAESWRKWTTKKSKTLEVVNEFLHAMEEPLELDGKLTLYCFRHSSFTHAINGENVNLMRIAKEGATSVKMLESHYYHL